MRRSDGPVQNFLFGKLVTHNLYTLQYLNMLARQYLNISVQVNVVVSISVFKKT